MVSDFILWLDLETTGNGPDDDIIEIGAVLTDKDYNTLTSFERVYRTKRAISIINPHVFKMHNDNGLWLETMEARAYAMDPGSEAAILEWLGKAGALKGGTASLPLAGSGTSHFDRRYIERDWPSLARRLTYWNLDIGVVRRFMRNWLSEQEFESAFALRPGREAPPKLHRAMSDTLQHIAEARLYRGYVKGD